MRAYTAAGLAALMALAACEEVTLPGRDTTPIAGNYAVTRIDGNPVPAPGITLTLRENGTFAGRSLCNTYQGRNATSFPGFRVGAFSNTRRGCDPNLQRVEIDYFQALTKATSLTQGSGGISLSSLDDSNNTITISASRR